MDINTILIAARAVGPVLGALPEIRALIEHAIEGLSETDQARAKASLQGLRQRTDEMHAEFEALRAERGV